MIEHSPTSKQLTWHDLRATGATWMAVRGDDPLKIKQRCGHTTFSTTELYIREAEAVREGFGEVFPALPACLFSNSPESPRDYSIAQKDLAGVSGSLGPEARLFRLRQWPDQQETGQGQRFGPQHARPQSQYLERLSERPGSAPQPPDILSAVSFS
jgi:hypothetical protein